MSHNTPRLCFIGFGEAGQAMAGSRQQIEIGGTAAAEGEKGEVLAVDDETVGHIAATDVGRRPRRIRICHQCGGPRRELILHGHQDGAHQRRGLFGGEAVLARAQGSLYEERIRKLLDGMR